MMAFPGPILHPLDALDGDSDEAAEDGVCEGAGFGVCDSGEDHGAALGGVSIVDSVEGH